MGRFKSVFVSLLAMLPGIVLRLSGAHINPTLASPIYALAIVGASFMLSWGRNLRGTIFRWRSRFWR
jgi:cation:H+ antiporter